MVPGPVCRPKKNAVMKKFQDIRSFFTNINKSSTSSTTNVSNETSSNLTTYKPRRSRENPKENPSTSNSDKSDKTIALCGRDLNSSTNTIRNRVEVTEVAAPISICSAGPVLNTAQDLGTLENGPSQPNNIDFPKTEFGNRLRSFSSKYYGTYKWLEYSVKEDKAFCFVCRQFLTGIVRQQNEKFVSSGFSKWKKLGEYLKKHEESILHIQCTEKYISYKRSLLSGTVVERVVFQHNEEILQNRNYLLKLIDIILYFVRQGLPLRGHREDSDSENRGNFLEFCDLFSKYDKLFWSHFNRSMSYCSPKIQNEIIDITAQLTLQEIVKEVHKCGFFSIMVDEARCYKEEQLTINIRYVRELEVEERYLCFINCSSSRDAQSLVDIIFDFFRNCNLSNTPIIAQSYDGASVMSGKYQGVQAKVREVHPQAIYIHCLAHRMNLVVVDSCANVSSATSFFNVLEALYVHFSQPGNHARLIKVRDSLGIASSSSFEIKSLSTTRWSCRYDNCNAVLKYYHIIIEVLDEEIAETRDKNYVEALGLLASIKKPEFIVSLFVFNNVLSITNILSKYFQSRSSTLGQANNLIVGTIASLEEKRNSFDDLWKEIEEFAAKNDAALEPIRVSKKRRQLPEKLKDYVIETTVGRGLDEMPSINSTQEYWKINIYNQVMDNVIVNFKRRFENMPLAASVDAFLKLDLEGGNAFIENYKSVFDLNKPTIQAEALITRNLLKTKNMEINLVNLKKEVNEAFTPNLYKLLQIAIGLPISSADCERSFSAMRRVKTWLRATMIQERFSNLALLHIENQIIKQKITSEHVLEEFAKKNRKIKLVS